MGVNWKVFGLMLMGFGSGLALTCSSGLLVAVLGGVHAGTSDAGGICAVSLILGHMLGFHLSGKLINEYEYRRLMCAFDTKLGNARGGR